MTDSELPPWAPHEFFCKKVFGLTIWAGDSFEMPEVTLGYPCQRHPNDYRSVNLTPQDADELAKELRRAIEIATGEGRRTRGSVFLHHIHDEDSFDPELGAWARLDPAEILVYADCLAVVLHLVSGDILPVMSDILSPKEAAAVEEASGEIARRGYQPFEVQEFAAFHPAEAREVVEVLEAAIAAFDQPPACGGSIAK